MNNYYQLYDDLAKLPPLELSQLLAEVLPYGEIKARMDGTVVLIHAYGLYRFQSTTDLVELGIPAEDPRNKVFASTLQNLVSENIQKLLRNHVSRIRAICRDQGAVEVWEGARKAWWVPVECFASFTKAVEAHILEFANLRNKHLVDQYDNLVDAARQNFTDSLEAAFEELSNGSGEAQTQEEYVSAGLGYFDQRFPSREEIRTDIRMEMAIVSRSLPMEISHKVEALREAEVQALTAEAAAQRVQTQKETQQLEIVQIRKQAELERLQILKEKRRKQEEILFSQMRPEITQMQEAMERITASTTMLADEIIRAASNGSEISSAISKSWNKRLERLRKLTPSNPRLGEAIEALQQLKEDTRRENKANGFSIQQAEKRVKEGLEELTTNTVFERFANDVFSLLRKGDREGVLTQIHQARAQHNEKLEELENLYQYVIEIMTRKEGD